MTNVDLSVFNVSAAFLQGSQALEGVPVEVFEAQGPELTASIGAYRAVLQGHSVATETIAQTDFDARSITQLASGEIFGGPSEAKFRAGQMKYAALRIARKLETLPADQRERAAVAVRNHAARFATLPDASAQASAALGVSTGIDDAKVSALRSLANLIVSSGRGRSDTDAFADFIIPFVRLAQEVAGLDQSEIGVGVPIESKATLMHLGEVLGCSLDQLRELDCRISVTGMRNREIKARLDQLLVYRRTT